MAIPSSDPWYRAEVVPTNLAKLGRDLAAFFGVPQTNVGIKGDPNTHFRGGHRSRAFLLSSPYATNRSYTVNETPGNRGGDPNWIAALDLTLPRAQLIAACQRLDRAVRAGQLEKVTEWFGNDDGDNRVDGYDNIHNAVSSADSSHLWHLHMTFERAHANDDHSDVFRVLTGQEKDDMDLTDRVRLTQPNVVGRPDIALVDLLGFTFLNTEELKRRQTADAAADEVRDKATLAAVNTLAQAVEELSKGGTSIDTAAVVAAVRDEATKTRAAVSQIVDQQGQEQLRLLGASIAAAGQPNG
jgi:hypothetical protein